MSKPTPRLPTKDDLALLNHYSALLHLLHHRNKNQHRRSPWYRHLSLFRRQLSALLTDYETLLSTPSTALARSQLKKATPALQTRVAARLSFWQEVLAARWMRAFSQLVADGRFSVLGLVMVGCLGGVCKVVGVTEGLEIEGQAEVERVLEEFGREVWGEEEGEVVKRDGEDGGEAVGRVDEGEVVARDAESGDGDGEGEGAMDVTPNATLSDEESTTQAKTAQRLFSKPPRPTKEKPPSAKVSWHISPSPPPPTKAKSTSTKASRQPSPTPPKPIKTKSSTKKRPEAPADTKAKPAKKKRKKGGDAIDDLFSGL